MTITIADGRGALWQWDTGRRLRVGSGVEQIHYQNKCFGRSVDVDVGDDGTAIIPDELLQDWHPLTAYAYVTDDTGAYTMVQQDFIVHKRAKPAGYVYTPTDQLTLQTIQRQIGDLADLTTDAKENLVAAINEALTKGGGGGSMDLRVADGYIQYSTDGGSTWQNLIAVADLKGADGAKGDKGDTGVPGPAGAPGKDGAPGAAGQDGHSPVVTATKSGKATTISVDGTAQMVRREKTAAPARRVTRGKPAHKARRATRAQLVLRARMARMANRGLLVRTASHRRSGQTGTGFSARPIQASHRAEQPVRRVTQVQPALLALLARKVMPGLPVRTARRARKAKKAKRATPALRALPVTHPLKARITGPRQTSRRS